MGRKRKKNGTPEADTRTESNASVQTDYSKYAKAKSNKSKVNYAELRLARPETSPEDEPKPEKGKKNTTDKKKRPVRKDATEKKSGKRKKNRDEKQEKGKDTKWLNSFGRNASRNPEVSEVIKRSESGEAGGEQAKVNAEKRYGDALDGEAHYSSVIEKFYLKYPDAKRPERGASRNPGRRVGVKKSHSGSGTKNDRSVAEIARENKNDPSVQERAKNIANGRARGVVPSRVAHHNLNGRKPKRSGALNVLIIFAMLVFISAVCMAVFFNVKTIKVSGNNPYTEEIVLKKCTFKKGDNILFINTDKIEERIVRELPYIEACTVKRRLPSSVTVSVTPAEVLGVVQLDDNLWSVLSVNGKILETDTNLQSVSPSDAIGAITYTPEFSSAEEVARAKDIPVIYGVYVKNHIKDGYISDDTLKTIRNFGTISSAARKFDMRLTEIRLDQAGYEVRYDDRIRIIFGETVDQKTVTHRFHEVHTLIFDEKLIGEDSRGEIRFYKQKTFFRPEYEVSEEDLERIEQERLESNRKRLIKIGEIFVTTGKNWYKGVLKTE